MQEANIQCRDCKNEEMTLRLVINDGEKSIIAHCKCGRAVEYRGIQQTIDLFPKQSQFDRMAQRNMLFNQEPHKDGCSCEGCQEFEQGQG